MEPRPLTRRRFLVGLTAGGAALAFTGCVRTTGSESPAASATPLRTASLTTSASPFPTPSSTVQATPTPLDEAAVRRLTAGMLLVGFRGLELEAGSAIAAAVGSGLGGVLLFSRDQTTGDDRNIRSPAQLARLTAALRAAADGALRIAVDQEGGLVSRLTPAHGFPATRSEAAIGATDDPAQALAAGQAMGATMAAAGLDLDLAPVVDVDVDQDNPAIGALERSFSADPAVVAAMAGELIRGLHEHKVLATIKHFPGIGSASANTDFDQADVTDTWTDAELEPYRTLFGLGLPDAVMSAHVVNRNLDPDLPASLSAATIDGLLRTDLGWDGPVITDDMGAVAITSRYERSEAIALAIEAGNDMLTFANQATYETDLAAQVIDAIVGHVRSGRISPDRLQQSADRRARWGPPLGV
jgi:beta-N-acetylhexosaminidase